MFYLTVEPFLQSADNIDDVCEYRGTQLDPDSEQNNAREHQSTDEMESDCLQAKTSNARASSSVKHKLMQLTNTSDQQTSNKKDEHIKKSLSSDKDWTMKEVEKFYNKVNEIEINDQANTPSNDAHSNISNHTDVKDKVDSRTYTRQRKQKQVENPPNKESVINMDDSEPDKPHSDRDNKCADERIPNQEHITKMAATTSKYTNDVASSIKETTVDRNQDNVQVPEAFSAALNSKSSSAFSIKVLADLKEEDANHRKQQPDQGQEECTQKNIESADIKPNEKSHQLEEKIDEDSDFYSKLMESKSQVNQRSPVKSFSLSTRQTNIGSSAATTTGASTSNIKKRSIFKSKALATTGSVGGNGNGTQGAGPGLKGRSLYKHKWSANNDDSPKEETNFRSEVLQRALTMPSTSANVLDFDDVEFDDPSSATPEMSFSSNRLVRVPTVTGTTSVSTSSLPGFDETLQEVVSVKCPKAQKTYYQVIKKTKKAHQIQDSGEFQEFNDDVEYILEGLERHNNLSTRCLSTVTLASKCMEPPFRMHLRAHGTVTKFFSELKDAPANPSLALCTSTVLFVLSQDRLNMDLDRESLELMLNLLDTDSLIKDALDGAGMSKRELEKNKSKVQEMVAAMKAKGRATNLSLDHISADHLAMETLLSMTSKRAGEWFKEELRELGGLDHLVRTISDCLAFLTADEISIWTEPLHNKLKKADRVLKVLESVTHENEENCQYLLEFQDSKFLNTIHSFYTLLDEEVPLHSNISSNNGVQTVTEKEDKDSIAYTLRESLLDVIRVYINLVHDYKSVPFGSRLSGEKERIFDLCLHGMFVLPAYLPLDKRFDILVLTLTLIINLVENCIPNR